MPYTYLIGWSQHDKWYYGVKYAEGCSPNDLWKTYFTSSKHVAEFRCKFGEPDVVEVRRVFDDPMKAREWEDKVLRRLAVPCSVKWLNRHHGGKYFGSQPKTIETRRKMSESRKALGIKMSDATKEKMRQAALARPPRKMGPMSEATKEKIRQSKIGKQVFPRAPMSEATKEKIRLSKIGVSSGPRSEVTKEKQRIAMLGRKRPDLSGDNNPSKRLDVRAKISSALTGHSVSVGTRAKIRAARLARKLEKDE